MEPINQNKLRDKVRELCRPRENKVNAVVCGVCFEVIVGDRAQCGGCGSIVTKPLLGISVNTGYNDTDTEQERRSFYINRLVFARAQGYKDGWASWRFKERYGFWPPPSFRSS